MASSWNLGEKTVESIIAFGIIAGIAFGLVKENCLGSETGTHNPAEDEVPAPKPEVPAPKPVVKKVPAKKPVAKKASVKKPAAKKAPAKKAPAKKVAVKK